MTKLAVLFVHGMGNQPSSYAEACIEELRGRLRDQDADPNQVRWKAAHWGPVIEGREVELYRRLSQNNDLDWAKIRRDVVISGFGDALAYVGPPAKPSPIYDSVHAVFAKALHDLSGELPEPDATPLVVIAHSLGCAMITDFIWNAQKEGRNDSFADGATLSGLVTFGCNMPLFTLALQPRDIKPIRFPGEAAKACFPGRTAAERAAALRWVNYFDPDDVLGFPLRPINGAYAKAVNEDVEINIGTILGAHTGYWTDNSFTKPVGRQLARLLEVLD